MSDIKDSPHIPVLLNEVLDSFKELKDGVFVDATLGYGGHSSAILKEHKDIHLIGIDRDSEAIEFSKKRLKEFKDRVEFKKGPFSEVLKEIDFSNLKGLLADFGVSSLQLDKLERGFSFNSDKLDMRMDQSSAISAKDIVNSYSLDELTKILREYGEIREAKKIAKKIVEYRVKKEISSSKELANLVLEVVKKKGKIHPATQLFQALRIEVNKELDEINALLDILEEKRPKGATIALITFHSLEDRLVKQRFRKWAKRCICPAEVMRCECGGDNNLGVEVTKKPIVASKEEIEKNPRSRSAKLRVFKFKE